MVVVSWVSTMVSATMTSSSRIRRRWEVMGSGDVSGAEGVIGASEPFLGAGRTRDWPTYIRRRRWRPAVMKNLRKCGNIVDCNLARGREPMGKQRSERRGLTSEN